MAKKTLRPKGKSKVKTTKKKSSSGLSARIGISLPAMLAALISLLVVPLIVYSAYNAPRESVSEGNVQAASSTRNEPSIVEKITQQVDKVRGVAPEDKPEDVLEVLERGENPGSNPGDKPGNTEEYFTEPILALAGKNVNPNAPLCDDHNPTAFHTLWNEEKGCHYDHTHGVDPADTIFSDVAGDWGVSYPWQTPNENEMKHKGYINLYTVAENGCEQFGTVTGNCITHILYQVHTMGTPMAIRTRFHSYRYAARVCKPGTNDCGIITGGGHADYGTLHCPYKKGSCPLPSDPVNPAGGLLPEKVAMDQPPYRATPELTNKQRNLRSEVLVQFWNNLQGKNNYEYYTDHPNEIVGTAWGFTDSWGWVDQSDVMTDHFQCIDGSCGYNHSRAHLWTFRIRVPAELGNKNSMITTTAYTDRHGHLVEGCTTAGVDCVPLVLNNVPGGTALLNRRVTQGKKIGNAYSGQPYEFDACFNENGKIDSCEEYPTAGWITPQLVDMNYMNH